MQDFNYLFSNCMEMTIELSCCKYPLETKLQGHWQDNKESLLSYLEAALGGIRGLVTDKSGTAVQGAVVTVLGLEEKKPAVYDLAVAPLEDAARKAAGSNALKETLEKAREGWAKRSVALELIDERDDAQEREYRELRRATALLKELLA